MQCVVILINVTFVISSYEGMVKRLLVFDHLKRENRRLMMLVAQAMNSRRPRRWHVRHIFRGRKIYGAWYSLIPIMREHDREEYFRFLRMTPESFDYILEKLGPIIQKHSNRESISPGERLAVTLRYYNLPSCNICLVTTQSLFIK